MKPMSATRFLERRAESRMILLPLLPFVKFKQTKQNQF
jgi:hypothetical protein